MNKIFTLISITLLGCSTESVNLGSSIGGQGGMGGQVMCGNGIVEPGEYCDDQNQQNSDGCDADCQLAARCVDYIDLNSDLAERNGQVTTYAGNTIGGTLQSLDMGRCATNALFEVVNSPRVVHKYTTGLESSVLFVDTESDETTFDTAIWAYRDCRTPNIVEICNDDIILTSTNGADFRSKIRIPAKKAQYLNDYVVPPRTSVFIVVSGLSDLDEGEYQLRIIEARPLFGHTFTRDLTPFFGNWEHSGVSGEVNETESASAEGFARATELSGDMTLTGSVNTIGVDNMVLELDHKIFKGEGTIRLENGNQIIQSPFFSPYVGHVTIPLSINDPASTYNVVFSFIPENSTFYWQVDDVFIYKY